jgi:cytochrome oxidase Cu insertion factor (SCO1/SenC/PrrC family)
MRHNTPLIAAMLAALLAAGPVAAHDGRAHPAPVSGPADNYVFAIPEPGSYSLPAIRQAAGGPVLDEHGAPRDLGQFVTGQVTVLAFIYTQCGDVCPTATLRLAQLHDLAAHDPATAARLRLVTMSFDPENDTPQIMREHAEQWRGAAGGTPEWLFLTAADAASLAPVLAAYDQTVGRKPDPNDPTGALNHILRVFLIDAEGTVRNIYSLDFLDPNLVLNDVRTLLMERGGRS